MKLIKTKSTDAGEMKVFESETTTRYEIFTKAGFYRGGKIYFADKVVEIFSGTAEVTMFENNADVTRIYTPEDGKFSIPCGIPNLFYFPEDTQMIEEFPIGTKTEEFERYREMKK